VNQKKLLIGIVAIAVAFGVFFKRSCSGFRPRFATRASLAPDFSLPQLNGVPLRLSDYRGKVVLLDFWATWCDPCREEIPRFVDLQEKYGAQGLQIIAVSMDDEAQPVRDFSRRFQMNYPVVMGNAKIGELYGGVLGLPVVFIVGRDGRIHDRYAGATDIAVFERKIVSLLR